MHSRSSAYFLPFYHLSFRFTGCFSVLLIHIRPFRDLCLLEYQCCFQILFIFLFFTMEQQWLFLAGWTKLVCTSFFCSAEHWWLTRNLCCLYAVLLNLNGSETLTTLSQKLFLKLIQLRAGLTSAHPSNCAWAQCGPAGNCPWQTHKEHLSVSALMATCSDGLVPSHNLVIQLLLVFIKWQV